MQTYQPNDKKQKKAYANQIKEGVKTAGGFVKFCYYLTKILVGLAYVLAIGTVLHVVFISHKALYLLFLWVTFFVPLALSMLPRTVYAVSLSRDYRFRRKETLTVSDKGFVYAYHDDRSMASLERFSYNVSFDKISKVEYDEKTAILTIFGDIKEDTFIGGTLKETNEWSQITLLNVYDIDLVEMIRSHINNK